jgi:hypothetical protein
MLINSALAGDVKAADILLSKLTLLATADEVIQ